MKPYPEPVHVKFGRISTLNFSKLTENFMFVSSFRMRKSCPPCPSLPTFKNKFFFSQRLRKPPVHVVLVVQLGHYIKSKCYVLLFSLRLRNPLVHVVLVVQRGHYIKTKFTNFNQKYPF